MKKRSNKRALVKYGFTAPLFIGMMVVASASIAKSEGLEKVTKAIETPLSETTHRISTQMVVQEDTTRNLSKNEEVFTQVEQNPEFIGGVQALYTYISKNLKYPKEAVDTKTEGKVFVKFIVQKDGSIAKPTILHGIGNGCDEEVVRIVKAMPNWKPGIQNGKPVNVYFTMPINFTLGEKTEPNEAIFITVDENPEFIGGVQALYTYIGENLKYPKEAIDTKTEGKVFVKFIVQKDGSIAKPTILHGIGNGCDEEVVRIVKAMPNWKPGIQNGKPVNVYFTMPINFTLGEKGAQTNSEIIGVGNKNVEQFTILKSNRLDNPVYFVNGKKVMTIEGINPQDIESISVLTGEEAIKQYGEVGKNSVVLITLKKK